MGVTLTKKLFTLNPLVERVMQRVNSSSVSVEQLPADCCTRRHMRHLVELLTAIVASLDDIANVERLLANVAAAHAQLSAFQYVSCPGFNTSFAFNEFPFHLRKV